MKVAEPRKIQIKKVRDHDYIYDPNYVVSHHKDFYRQARKSAVASSQYTVHPVFNTMFSDLKYTRLQVVGHPNARLPKHMEICYPRPDTKAQTASNIEGRNRALFFSAPKTQQPIQGKYEQEREVTSVPQELICVDESRFHNKGVQTLYRESSAQTDPYQPDYYISKKCKDGLPEILEIDNIYSSHEGNILAVHRQRVRRAWLQRAMDFNILAQLDQYEYKFREREVERMLVLQEEKAGLDIVTTVDKERLSNLWSVRSQRLQNKIKQIRHNKEREIRKIEAKGSKVMHKTKRIERYPSTCVKKPFKLAVNLNYLPNVDDFSYQTINLNPTVKNKFGVCDKFMKKRERYMGEIKKELQKILEPEEETTEDMMCDGEYDDEECEDTDNVEMEQVIITEIEKVDKTVATDYLFVLLDTGCEAAKLASLQEHFAQVKKTVLKYILDSLNKELDNVLEEKLLKEITERRESDGQVTEIVKEIILLNKTSKEQLEIYKEVAEITQEISSDILNKMFEEVSQKIFVEKRERATVERESSASAPAPRSKSSSSATIAQERISSKDTSESFLADIIMDMILPLVVEEIERRRYNMQGDERISIIKQDSKESFSVGSFMESIIAHVTELAGAEEIVEDEQSTQLNVGQIMPEVLRIVETTGSLILHEIFNEMSRRISSREFRIKHGLDDEHESVLSKKSGESFIREVIMHELLPEVIEELRRGKKMASESSIGLGETIDDKIGHMIKVVGVVQNVASDILNDMIQETTQESFSRIERKQSSTSTKMKRTFITEIVMDTLMPQVVEELRRKNRAKCGYLDEDAMISEVVQVIQGAASDFLNMMLMPRPAQGTDICTCREQPIEEYMWDIIVTSLPKNIRAEIDPRYYFDFNEETTENFIWDLIVGGLPKHIREELISSRDITQMTKVVGLIQRAASHMFTHIFTEVSQQIISHQSHTGTHSNESFFMEIIMGAIMPRVMEEIERRERPSYDELQNIHDHSQVLGIIEKVASGILDEMLNAAKCQKTLTSTSNSQSVVSDNVPETLMGKDEAEIQGDVEAETQIQEDIQAVTEAQEDIQAETEVQEDIQAETEEQEDIQANE